MKKILAAIAVVTLFASCEKEGSIEIPGNRPATANNGGSSNGNRLYRIGTRFGSDSITTTYGYNTAGHLITFVQSGTVTGIPITAQVRYVRNAANIITSSIVKNEALAQFGLDSVESFHTYDAANSRYKHSISSITSFGDTETDSIVYVYNAGKLAAAIDYYDDGLGTGYVPLSKEEYTYTGANLTQIKSFYYDDTQNAFVLEETITYEHDLKINPAQFVADASVTSMRLYYSANNTIKATTLQSGTSTPVVGTTIFTYNAANKPITATSGSGASGSVSTYYYQ